jgi:hypothetical protein
LSKKLVGALVAIASVIFCMALVMWFWKSVVRNFKQKSAGS